MGLLGDVASYGKPAEQPILPFPFQELAAMGSQLEARADRNTAPLNAFADALANQKVLPGNQQDLMNVFNGFYEEMEKIVDDAGGITNGVTFRNKARNLVRKFSSNTDVKNMVENYNRVNSEQESMMKQSKYRNYNDPNSSNRYSLLTGSGRLDPSGELYRQKAYIGNEDVDNYLNNIVDDVVASGGYKEEIVDGESYIIGKGNKEITVNHLKAVTDGWFDSFMMSNAGGEYKRKASFKLNRNLTNDELKALYDLDMRGRILEKVRRETKFTIKSNATGLAKDEGLGIPGYSQISNSASSFSALEIPPEMELTSDGEMKSSLIGDKRYGIFVSGGGGGTKQLPEDIADAPETKDVASPQLKAIIRTMNLKNGKDEDYTSGKQSVDFIEAVKYINEFNKKKRVQKNYHFSGKVKRNKEDLFNGNYDLTNYYRPSKPQDVISWKTLQGENYTKVEFTGREYASDNPYSPAAMDVVVSKDDGTSETLIADNISGISSDQYNVWVSNMPFNSLTGEVVMPLDMTTFVDLRGRGLTFIDMKETLKKRAHIEIKLIEKKKPQGEEGKKKEILYEMTYYKNDGKTVDFKQTSPIDYPNWKLIK